MKLIFHNSLIHFIVYNSVSYYWFLTTLQSLLSLILAELPPCMWVYICAHMLTHTRTHSSVLRNIKLLVVLITQLTDSYLGSFAFVSSLLVGFTLPYQPREHFYLLNTTLPHIFIHSIEYFAFFLINEVSDTCLDFYFCYYCLYVCLCCYILSVMKIRFRSHLSLYL